MPLGEGCGCPGLVFQKGEMGQSTITGEPLSQGKTTRVHRMLELQLIRDTDKVFPVSPDLSQPVHDEPSPGFSMVLFQDLKSPPLKFWVTQGENSIVHMIRFA